jgi:hypothetical protein
MPSNYAVSKLNLLNDDELWALVRGLFKDEAGQPLELYDYELEILKAILYKENNRNLCWATTRCGKSMTVSVAVILAAISQDGERIRIISDTNVHTKVIKGYVDRLILDNQLIIDKLPSSYKNRGVEHLKDELNKERITFDNGSDIMTLTANILGEGRTLVGFGGTIIIVDEGEQIPEEIMRAKVMRMLGDSADSLIFVIGNPLKPGFMYTKKKDSNWRQIIIGWERCVQAGRFKQTYIDEMRASITDVEFDIWYNAIYPPEGEDNVIPWSWIERAKEEYAKLDFKEIKPISSTLGCDIARYGSDWTIMYAIQKTETGQYILRETHKYEKKDTMTTVGNIRELDAAHNYDLINIDEAGLGGGVIDRLKETDIANKVTGIQAGESPDSEDAKKRFLNKKAEMYFNLRKLFEDKLIMIPNDVKLVDQLSKFRYDFTSSRKIKLIDPGGHSPDEADSLALSCYAPSKPRLIIDLG